MKFFILDDESANLDVYRAYLHGYGDVLATTNLKNGVEMVEREATLGDVVISDWELGLGKTAEAFIVCAVRKGIPVMIRSHSDHDKRLVTEVHEKVEALLGRNLEEHDIEVCGIIRGERDLQHARIEQDLIHFLRVTNRGQLVESGF